MDKRRVVITGMGAVTPLGLTLEESWSAVKADTCGIGPITQYDTTNQKVKLAGEVRGFNPEQYIDKREVRKTDRFVQFALASAAQAMEHSGLVMENENSQRCGVVFASGIGGFSTVQNECLKGNEKGYDRVSPYFIPMAISNMAAGNIAIRFGFHGMCTCPVTACASGTNAVGDAFRQIRDGYADVILAGGSEATITSLAVGGFTSLHALHTGSDPKRASIPFDKERSGFVMGEGAAALVLEEYEHAKARGANILAEVVGYGCTCDAHHITAPLPDGSGAAGAMTQALADAGVNAASVDYINAHGTSTAMNDAGETAAVKLAFGEHAKELAISSTKSMTGHLLGASGAVEAAFTAMALHDGFIPATLGYQVPDEACDLDVVPNHGREASIRYAMSNSLGFGGHNASILLKKWEE
ncbi:beta-ketoacyl-ACP synthase II [Allofournierella massiliensis]|uniref:3-oxoacyl-[acyl-carrier-protein] synthase 2 n=1 Tax=Allofournierella massiliensis TaxID=1650663 RepID=A0A4R1R6S1_9FIRM|nr:beta-ketoacyl-ACP synthase II [Fournierella massiliensis]TCL61291.1 3-oxoacyl-[acyl-carrier-protein] synthase II [Fournierella massiliensis]